MNNILLALPPVLLFGFVGAALTRNRFSARITLAVWIAGIAVIAAAHLAAGLASADNARLLTLLPVTAYLPCVVLTFVLSERNVVSNLFVILIGLIASVIVELLLKLCRPPLLSAMTGAGIGADIVMFLIEALVSAALGFAVFRFLRGIFRRKTLLAVKDWYILASLFLLTGLSLYLLESTINVSAIVLVLLVNISVFAVIIGYLNARGKNETLRRERECSDRQIAAIRAEYALAEQKLELSRRYRHDMRHHFAVIKGLYRQGEPDKAAEYIDTLGEQLSAGEQKRYCKNPVVNAVLSVLSEKAQAAGIDVSMRLDIPEELPFDNADICTVLANATENAVNACARAPEARRHIELTADLIGRTRLVLSVKNGVRAPVPLDGDGLPAAQKTEEHGYGLLNVRRIVEKYDGLWQCESGEETFGMKIILFAPTEPPAGRKRIFRPRTLAAIPAFLLAAVLFLNCLPSTVEALSEIPVIGRAVRVLDFRTWGIGWGDSGIRTEYPETDSPDVNARVAEYIAAYKATAETYFQTKYNGYVGADFTSTILRYDEKLLTIELACTINAGSSLSYCRYVTADNGTGDIVELADLFRDDADWDAVLSEEILRQIRDRVENAYDNYYGFGIFESDRGFSSLLDPEIYCDGTARPNFYIGTDGLLVIVFDEGEIAPGNTGTPVFVIPAEVTESIAAEDGILHGGGYA